MPQKDIPPVKLFFPKQDIEQLKEDLGRILESGMLTLGEYTRRFEAEYAKLCGVRHAVSVNSGTSALEIALRTLGLKSGDEVLVPTNTFTATASVVCFSGCKLVLTDVNPDTLCIDEKNVQKYMTPKTRGVMVVHIGGLICPDIKAIKEICEDNHLFLIEDAAHAQGSSINGQSAGSLGEAGCFSFYPTKVMTTGEGGMVTTSNDKVAEKARILRDQGKENFQSNIIIELGYNWRLTEIGAALGITQLKRLHEIIERRNKAAQHYDKKLNSLNEIKPLKTPSNMVNNYYKYVAFLDPSVNREKFKQLLREKGVKCSGEVYWPPLHLQPVYKKLLDTGEGDFPITEDVCKRMVCLPIYAQMSIEDAEYVTDKIEETLSEV